MFVSLDIVCVMRHNCDAHSFDKHVLPARKKLRVESGGEHL